MNVTKQHHYHLVGAQFIGAPPIYRPGKPIAEPLADKSAMGAMNRHLLMMPV
jgi:hypothetical protein